MAKRLNMSKPASSKILVMAKGLKAIDRTGARFGRLLVLSRAPNRNSRTRWCCRCDCGVTCEVNTVELTAGKTNSCGCLREELRASHGHTKRGRRSPTYNSWSTMTQRCTNPDATGYALYGGRGIKVCDRWRKFEDFLADMGERPRNKTLDRYPDNDGDYEPGNCRWATGSEQGLNRRMLRKPAISCKRGHELSADNLRILNGRRLCMTCLRGRARVALGWPEGIAFSAPLIAKYSVLHK